VLHAQPIVELATGVTVQHELLVRMRGRDSTMVAPAQFLPTAEQHGLITEIDCWVIGQAAKLCGEGHRVQLNLSAASLAEPGLFDVFRTALDGSLACPQDLVVELTETALMSNERSATVLLERLSQLGCKIALDDFGTGYGGFAYLKRFPVDYLKIDREFIADIATNAASHHVVAAVVSLAKGFGQQTVAEGIEDADTIALLIEMGVDYGQGFALGRSATLQHTLLRHPPAIGDLRAPSGR
jgi:EAL domain-containing protein (putative c-di-GMP-specific phosphodiesterase class I)